MCAGGENNHSGLSQRPTPKLWACEPAASGAAMSQTDIAIHSELSCVHVSYTHCMLITATRDRTHLNLQQIKNPDPSNLTHTSLSLKELFVIYKSDYIAMNTNSK